MGLSLAGHSSFHLMGKVKSGILFSDSRVWVGTWRSAALRRLTWGFLSLFVIHILAKDRGKFLELKLCMNLSWDIVMSCSRGRIPSSLKSGMVWAWAVDFEIWRIAFFCLMKSLFNGVLGAQP